MSQVEIGYQDAVALAELMARVEARVAPTKEDVAYANNFLNGAAIQNPKAAAIIADLRRLAKEP